VDIAEKERDVGEPTSEQRGAQLVQELRAMIAASYLAGDREMTAEKRHATAAVRAAVQDALEQAAALVAQAQPPLDPVALAAAIRALKETP
jgi:hypothetical protein